MFKKTLASLFVLALSACSHGVQTAASPIVVQPSVVSPAVVQSTATKTFSGSQFEVVVPATFTRLSNDDGEEGFNALDRTNRTTMFMEISEFPGTLDQVARAFAMRLASRGVDIQSMKPTVWANHEGLTVVATKDTPKGKAYINSWATLTEGRVYNFGCIVLPSTTIDPVLQQKVCETAALTVKLMPAAKSSK